MVQCPLGDQLLLYLGRDQSRYQSVQETWLYELPLHCYKCQPALHQAGEQKGPFLPSESPQIIHSTAPLGEGGPAGCWLARAVGLLPSVAMHTAYTREKQNLKHTPEADMFWRTQQG